METDSVGMEAGGWRTARPFNLSSASPSLLKRAIKLCDPERYKAAIEQFEVEPCRKPTGFSIAKFQSRTPKKQNQQELSRVEEISSPASTNGHSISMDLNFSGGHLPATNLINSDLSAVLPTSNFAKLDINVTNSEADHGKRDKIMHADYLNESGALSTRAVPTELFSDSDTNQELSSATLCTTSSGESNKFSQTIEFTAHGRISSGAQRKPPSNSGSPHRTVPAIDRTRSLGARRRLRKSRRRSP
jgi:hypothetical protein